MRIRRTAFDLSCQPSVLSRELVQARRACVLLLREPLSDGLVVEEAVAAWQLTRLLARLERAEGHPALRRLLAVLGLADHHQREAFDLGRRAELGGRLLHLLVETPEQLVVLRANLLTATVGG